MIPTRIHGILDYVMGVALAVVPPMLYGVQNPAGLVPLVLGIVIIMYSAITAYELAIVRVIPMKVHLLMDAIGGVLLASSPWVFGFADVVWAPHLVLGLAELGAAGLTTTRVRDRGQRVTTT